MINIVIRYNSVWRANQEQVGIHNDAAHEELVNNSPDSIRKAISIGVAKKINTYWKLLPI